MNSDDYTIHARYIDGIESRVVFDWFGRPMTGMYFVRSALPGSIPDSENATVPILLIPGGVDPQVGEYSEALVRNLLERVGAPDVSALRRARLSR
ncbi:MAG: hypothetical protein QGG73_13500 [Candidatus Hydrogenedentes bacterium]|jgi:hypothetical protein|nr:hypothetical protein [Candidatus Hydrogenedentota bacterium]